MNEETTERFALVTTERRQHERRTRRGVTSVRKHRMRVGRPTNEARGLAAALTPAERKESQRQRERLQILEDAHRMKVVLSSSFPTAEEQLLIRAYRESDVARGLREGWLVRRGRWGDLHRVTQHGPNKGRIGGVYGGKPKRGGVLVSRESTGPRGGRDRTEGGSSDYGLSGTTDYGSNVGHAGQHGYSAETRGLPPLPPLRVRPLPPLTKEELLRPRHAARPLDLGVKRDYPVFVPERVRQDEISRARRIATRGSVEGPIRVPRLSLSEQSKWREFMRPKGRPRPKVKREK